MMVSNVDTNPPAGLSTLDASGVCFDAKSIRVVGTARCP